MVLAICLFLLNSALLVFIYWLSRGLKISGFEHDPISGAEENVLSLPSLGMRQHAALRRLAPSFFRSPKLFDRCFGTRRIKGTRYLIPSRTKTQTGDGLFQRRRDRFGPAYLIFRGLVHRECLRAVRYWEGVCPVCALNTLLKKERLLNPTDSAISVMLMAVQDR